MRDGTASYRNAGSWSAHLLPAFGERLVCEITVSDVERYAADKLSEADPISPRSINATITLLAQILEAAVDRDLIPRNVARGRGRKVRERSPARSYLETAGADRGAAEGRGQAR